MRKFVILSKARKSCRYTGKELLDMALSRGAPDNVTVGLLSKII